MATKKKKKVGRKPLNEKRHNLHIHLNHAIYAKALKRAERDEIPIRRVCEQALMMFLSKSA